LPPGSAGAIVEQTRRQRHRRSYELIPHDAS